MIIDFNKTNNLATLVKKQLARGRYVIDGVQCKLNILVLGEINEIILDDYFDIKKIKNYSTVPNEASCNFFDKFLQNKIYGYGNDLSLIRILSEYKENNVKPGHKLKCKRLFKLFSKDEVLLNKKNRDEYGVVWIDYVSQLRTSGNIIYDENNINGLWAMTPKALSDIDDKSIENFGDNIFILEPMSNCSYLETDMEIIGDRFKVLRTINISPNRTIRNLQFWLIKKLNAKK